MSREREFDPRDLLLVVITCEPRFPVGQLVITANARDRVDRTCWLQGLNRHLSADWGEVDEDDRKANDMALKQGDRLVSAYTDSNGERFWIITEWDRSVTTVLLPEDY
jgi:hypothetical protein